MRSGGHRLRTGGRFFDLFPGEAPAEIDIFRDGVGKEDIVLKHDAELGVQDFRRNRLHPLPADPDLARVCVVQAHQQRHDGAFPAARRPDDAEALSALQAERDIPQIGLLFLIGKGDAVKYDVIRPIHIVRRKEGQILRRVQHLADPFG